jgi:hypothetical protein
MKAMRSILIVLQIVVFFVAVDAAIVSKKTVLSCQYSYEWYYDDSAATCSSVVAINVGTSMSVNDYTKLAKLIVSANTVSTSTVVIIVDNNLGCIINVGVKKDDGAKFARVVNAAVQNLKNSVSICTNPLYFVGGHSGGGKGAMNAIQMGKLNFSIAGYVGLDPYQITKEDPISIEMPSLFWGFNKTTCAVNINQAAKAGYINSNSSHRFFYQVQTNHGIGMPWFDERLLGPHCSFTNDGCKSLCNGTNLPWIQSQVAVTFHRFAHAVLSQNFDKSQFVIDQREVILYANKDVIPESVTLLPVLLEPEFA